MLILYGLFWLLIERVEEGGCNIAECIHKDIDLRYRAIASQKFVISCDASEDPTSVFNHSHLYEKQVQWFWQSSDGQMSWLLKKKTINPAIQGNALWFDPISVQHSGMYTCMNRGEMLKCVNTFIDVQTNEVGNCSYSSMSDRYLFVLHKGTIPCPGKDCYSTFLQTSVKWYKNGLKVRLTKSRPGLKFENDEIILSQVFDKDNGTYMCDYMVLDNNTWWKMRTILNVNIVTKDTTSPPNVLNPNGERILEVELGEPLELNCSAQFGFEMNASSSMEWYRETSKNKQRLLQKRVDPKGLEGRLFILVYTWSKVSEDDLTSSFLCLAQNSIGNSTGRIKLKRKTEKAVHYLTALCCTISITAFGVLFGMLAYWQRIEIALFFRYYLAKDETVGDCKEFDAFVSYEKSDSSEPNQALPTEEQFALEVLAEILENKYGYKLCFTERDILPGGAYTEDIVNAIKRSRRVIVILSPNYVNGQVFFELEAAVKTAFEDKTIKIILIQFQPFQEPQFASQNVKKALRILPKISWKTSVSPTANKRFWKELQYHMPVKCTKGNRLHSDSLTSTVRH